MGEDVLLCGNCRKKVSYKILRRRVTTVVRGVEIPMKRVMGYAMSVIKRCMFQEWMIRMKP